MTNAKSIVYFGSREDTIENESALRKVLVCEVLVLRVKAKWILNFLFKIPSFNVFTGAIMLGQSDGLGI